MISPTDEGFTDEDIQGLRLSRMSHTHTIDDHISTSAHLTSPWRSPDTTGTQNYISDPTPHTYRFKNLKHDAKGKGVDWGVRQSITSDREREELAYQLLASLPRSRLAGIQRRIAPLLQFDLVGSLPPELSLLIFMQLPAPCLLVCALVCKRWHALANDTALWRRLCEQRGWIWRSEAIVPPAGGCAVETKDNRALALREDREEDEGMGDEEEGEDEGSGEDVSEVFFDEAEMDSGFMTMSAEQASMEGILPPLDLSPLSPPSMHQNPRLSPAAPWSTPRHYQAVRQPRATLAPDYRLLHQTHTLLRNRVRRGDYRMHALPGADGGGHGAAVYCLWLWTYPPESSHRSAPLQVLFTGSKDRTAREWDLRTGQVRRVIGGVHQSSVLSLCVASCPPQQHMETDEEDAADKLGDAGMLVSGGSDRRVVIWDLGKDRLVDVLWDHEDSVLCVRADSGRLVTCSKDRTIRTYAFPSLERQFVFRAHRAAVNAVSIVGDVIVSASGDRSVRVWDARTGALMNTFEDHHERG
ncbi:WD40 repeat-like protein [Leucogyrophana mollusca]|uniref:WD40 repeat-like protein n=1 Tax=Leucogyrophana mollusca TaxID=85980 RepID=A0ACB8BCK7_9AGAM|nr:WD40 repeat-like protein [Leucogyrophana mollusca]